jgi:hypothetical protein
MLSECSYEQQLHDLETEHLDAQQTAGVQARGALLGNAVRGAANGPLLVSSPSF